MRVSPLIHDNATAGGSSYCLSPEALISLWQITIFVKVIAVVEDSDELGRILRHLLKMGRSPPGLDPNRLN